MTHLNQEVALTLKIEGEAFASWDGLDDMVVRRIADHFISDHGGMKLRERVQGLISETVTAVVQARVEAFLTKPIPPLTRYGEPIVGAVERSLADMIADAADAAMVETVDPHDGKAKKKDSYNNAIPRLEWLVKKVAVSEIAKAVETSVKAVNAEAKAAVQKQVAAAIAAHLAAAK